MSFTYCTITQSVVYGLVEQQDQTQPALTLDASHAIDSNITFHTLNISETLFSNSPISTPIDGACDITYDVLFFYISLNYEGLSPRLITCAFSPPKKEILPKKGIHSVSRRNVRH